MFDIFSSLPQFKRRLVQERTTAGLTAARAGDNWPVANGSGPMTVVTAKNLHKARSLSIDQLCERLRISEPTFYRLLALRGIAVGGPTQAP